MIIMIKFQYLTRMCYYPDLQPLLTKFGEDGWRLHTCDSFMLTGPQGSGLLQVFVVMDRIIDEEPEIEIESESELEGIAMKG